MPYDKEGLYWALESQVKEANARYARAEKAKRRAQTTVQVINPSIKIRMVTPQDGLVIDTELSIAQASKLFDLLANALEKVGERNGTS